jgi:diguanylate cyclase (GGDEF)-like protein
MRSGEPATRKDTEEALERAAYAQRIRRTNERLALAVCAIFAVTGLLPITEPASRAGVLWTAGLFLILVVAWFRLVPPTAFGDRRVLIFSVLVQPILVVLITLTGGNNSLYFPYLLLSVMVTVYSPNTRHTIIVGAACGLGLAVVAVLDRGNDAPLVVAGRLVTELLQLLAFVLFTAFAGRALREARRAITVRAEALASEHANAMQLAFTDALTGLYNRRYADDVLKRLVFEAARGRPFSVLALDLDGLKRINDTLGHAAGDRVIVRIGELLRLQLRGADVPIRHGGDEFLALLAGTREDQAKRVGERLQAAVRDDDWSTVGVRVPVTVSVGAAEWRSGESGDDVVKGADARLYEAKRALHASG